MRDQEHRPAGQPLDRLADDRALSGSRSAVGSSSTTSGASRRNARASASRRRWPAESGRPPSPTIGRVALRQGADEAVGAGEHGGPRTRSAEASGSPSAMFSATVPRKIDGLLRHPGHEPPPRLGVARRRGRRRRP